MKAYWGSGGISTHSWPRHWMEVSGQLHAPAALLPGKEYPLNRRLGEPQSRSWRGGEEKNSQPLPGLESAINQPVIQRCTTELWLPVCELY
jgi:hypothetical protein